MDLLKSRDAELKTDCSISIGLRAYVFFFLILAKCYQLSASQHDLSMQVLLHRSCLNTWPSEPCQVHNQLVLLQVPGVSLAFRVVTAVISSHPLFVFITWSQKNKKNNLGLTPKCGSDDAGLCGWRWFNREWIKRSGFPQNKRTLSDIQPQMLVAFAQQRYKHIQRHRQRGVYKTCVTWNIAMFSKPISSSACFIQGLWVSDECIKREGCGFFSGGKRGRPHESTSGPSDRWSDGGWEVERPQTGLKHHLSAEILQPECQTSCQI